MFPHRCPHTPGVLRKLPSASVLVVSLLWSATVWSQPGPRILHDGLSCILAGEHVILEALVEPPDELITIKAYFRADLYSLYYYVEMTRVGDVYQAVLPKPSSQISGVVYYLEAVDSAFNSVRTEEFHPQVVVDTSSCRERNPAPPAYFDGPANITVGATGEGASFPPGFLTDGVIGTITAAGRVAASSGGGVGTAVAVAAAGGAAVGVGILVTGGDGDTTTTSTSSPGGGTSSVTTTTVPPTSTSPPGTIVMACFDTSPDPPTIPVGGTVRFDASCTQPDRDSIATYAWRFNDGRSDREGRVVSRVYNDGGVFPAELTVTDLNGNHDTVTRDVTVLGTGGPGPGPGPTTTIPGPTTSVPTTTTTVPGSADLAIPSLGAPGGVTAGANATYTINYQNNGPNSDPTVTIVSTFNAAGLGGAPSLIAGGCSGATGPGSLTVTCFIGALASGTGGSRVITVQFPSADTYFVNASISGGTTDPNPGNNSRSVSTPVALRTGFDSAERLQTRFMSFLDVPPGDGRSRGRVTINGDRTDITDSSAPATHDVLARSDENVVEGIFVGNVDEGRWRFDFSQAPHFEPGSLSIDEGQLLARTADEIVFRIGPDARRAKFRFRLRP